MLPSSGAGLRQQDTEKTTSASLLPLCPGNSLRTKEASKQKPAPPATSTAALTIPQGCRRILQETWKMSAQWDRRQRLGSLYQERHKQAQAEWAAWEAWFAGHNQEPAQLSSEKDLSPREDSSRILEKSALAEIDRKRSTPESRGHLEFGSEKTWAPPPPAQSSPGEKRTRRGGKRPKTLHQWSRREQQPSWRESSLTTFPLEQLRF
ncbi:uncharacterized protein [Struthio camelus]|uniref:uncharacterized protein n=1 Tax=Struthio camelus TaxID=8801 RepID=UPI003603B783